MLFPHINWVLSFFPLYVSSLRFLSIALLIIIWVFIGVRSRVSFLLYWSFVIILKIFLLAIYYLFYLSIVIKPCGPFSYLAYKLFTVTPCLLFFSSFNFVLFIVLLFFVFFFGFQPCSRIFDIFSLIKISFMSSCCFTWDNWKPPTSKVLECSLILF